MDKRTCTKPGCARPSQARGICRTHYAAWWRSPEGRAADKPMGRPAEQPKPCTADGCQRNANAKGLCLMHYKREARTGKVGGLTLADKFFRHVTEDPSGCWLWDKPGANGYGQFTVGKVNGIAHRWVYEFMVAPIPDGLTIDHLCRVTACVNPWHLDPVPIDVNIRRAAAVRYGQ